VISAKNLQRTRIRNKDSPSSRDFSDNYGFASDEKYETAQDQEDASDFQANQYYQNRRTSLCMSWKTKWMIKKYQFHRTHLQSTLYTIRSIN
ncbi:hypothetical protein Bpfe_004018, partial [Biomphalaria pfeifferi]